MFLFLEGDRIPNFSIIVVMFLGYSILVNKNIPCQKANNKNNVLKNKLLFKNKSLFLSIVLYNFFFFFKILYTIFLLCIVFSKNANNGKIIKKYIKYYRKK